MSVRALCVTALMVAAGLAHADPEHEGDFVIATNGAGALAIEGGEVGALAFNDNFNIWVGDEPGFTSLDVDEPDEGLFVLPGSAFISIEILSADPGLRVLDPLFDPFSQSVEDATVSMFELGSPSFDDHPFWVVQLSEWDGVTTEFNVMVRAVDSGAGLAPSDPFMVTLTIPAPASAGVMGLGLLGLGSRRRRG